MKSHESDLLRIAACVYKDAAAKCPTESPYQERDLDTLRARVENEGLSFLTITLPQLGADLERSLSKGGIEPGLFRNFRKRLKVPAFLQGFFAQIFDVGTGLLLPEPCVTSIEGIRQIAYTFKKVKLDCSPKRIRKAIAKFMVDEHELQRPIPQCDVDDFVSVCKAIWPYVVSGLSLDDAQPKHGPGATAERISGNAKYIHRRWHERLEAYFPFFHNAYSSETALWSKDKTLEKVTFVPAEQEEPVRVITVPKTLKAPRIIAIEPVCMQYTQQAISKVLVQTLETSKFTAGQVNFTDQSINQRLALKSSADESLATLDLSAASDRVPVSLALRMFDSNPVLQGAIFACRSRSASLPTGDVIPLSKFASMGSALCFPVEAMYFYTICVASLLKSRKLPVTPANARKCGADVYVYGDDIIVPVGEVEVVVDGLQKYYCKVGSDKSFWTGKFRESCGMDAYNGEEVTPTYVRNSRPRNKHDGSALLSWVASSNLFYKKGYWKTASHMINVCESILGKLPIVGPACAGLGKHSFQPYVSAKRWNRKYHRPEVRTWVAAPVYRKDKLEGCSALTKSLLQLEARDKTSFGTVGADHLVRTARHGAVSLKRRWTQPY